MNKFYFPLLAVLMLSLSSCHLIALVFKAGMIVAVIAIIIVVAIIAWIISLFRGK
jgi:hypothetical protein